MLLTEADPPNRAQPPQVPDHQLLRKIGGGSYGEVWLARNTLGTLRAVKIVYRHVFEDNRPFEREFRGIQRFEPISRTHEGLVDILQVGSAEDHFYYVMELADPIENPNPESRNPKEIRNPQSPIPNAELCDPASYSPRTLRAVLKARGCLPASECVGLGLCLARALAHLHEHGLVHRDVKPSNIIFVEGIPKLADIGLVADLSDARSFVGTEGFIPPEGPGAPQADLYGLGKVLYEAATGKDRRDFPWLPEELAENESVLELNAVILKACKADASERYRSADEMASDLALLAEGGSLRQRRAAQRRRKWLARAALLMCAMVTVVMGISAVAGDPVHRRPRRLGVLSWASFLSGRRGSKPNTTNCERIADGLTAALIQVPGLKLAPRKWAYALTDKEPDPLRFASALHLDQWVTIRLSSADEGLILSADLIRITGGRQHWTEKVLSDRTNVVAAQWKLVTSLAESLGLVWDREHHTAVDMRLANAFRAYELVQRARQSWGDRRENFTAQIDGYSEAIALDPDYVSAQLELAYVYRNMSDNFLPAREAMPQTLIHSRRALGLDDTHPSAIHHLATYLMCYAWDWDEAETLFRREKDITGRWNSSYGCWLESLGRFDEAQRIWERNAAEYPDNSYNWGFGYYFFLRRDYHRALNVVLHAELYPRIYDDVLARCYEELGRYPEALEAIRRKRSHADGPEPIAKEGHILARMGRDAEARERLEELSSMSRYRYISPVYPAIVNTGLGDLTAAFAWREKAYERSECMVFSQSYGLGVDPDWDPLRGDPRYTDLLRRVGLLDRLQPLSAIVEPRKGVEPSLAPGIF